MSQRGISLVASVLEEYFYMLQIACLSIIPMNEIVLVF